jgi:prepilin-type N-terminal cleavage/methylation domain-containing protein
MNLELRNKGFTLTEAVVTVAIIGTLSSIALPNYVATQQRSKCSETKATLASIPPIIGAYIDATGETPTTWDDLSSIAPVMTSSGPATGLLSSTIKLPRSNYELSIEGPSESTYSLTANCYITPTTANTKKDQIRSCFNVSNGASDLRIGSSSDSDNTPNCG